MMGPGMDGQKNRRRQKNISFLLSKAFLFLVFHHKGVGTCEISAKRAREGRNIRQKARRGPHIRHLRGLVREIILEMADNLAKSTIKTFFLVQENHQSRFVDIDRETSTKVLVSLVWDA